MDFCKLHRKKIYIAVFISTFALSSCTKSFSEIALNESSEIPKQWEVVKVSDGDTITVRQGQEKKKIRLCGIDAPESKQPLGQESKGNLQRLVDEVGGKVSITEIERDRYGRIVGEVFSSKNGSEKFLNEEQLSSGNGYLYTQYAGKCPNKIALGNAEAIAKSKKLGVWSGNFQKPWDYRKQQRQR
ncbi:thermonuclease family protein [Nostoc sp. 2RC]|uniref:thermonuclease family protein n=1 Tax=Nostoc sp. 2RC TaxID=2485484 RepID=UPI0016285593|nr:thermonuclease family protein [Nostoc sp. 2RC]MBC1237575.1 thermonuclease family protein [Nostoc sp. 2RC]